MAFIDSAINKILKQLAPGEDLEGKCAKRGRDRAGIEYYRDVVVKHLDSIGIEGAING